MARRGKEVLTYKQFADMTYDQLLKTLKEMLGQAKRVNVWFSAIERVNLLPALQAMHDKVAQPGRRTDLQDSAKPTWEDVCRIHLGISPTLVRMWRMRTQAHTDIRHLLGEEEDKRKKKSPEDSIVTLKQQMAEMAQEITDGQFEDAEKRAMEWIERWGF